MTLNANFSFAVHLPYELVRKHFYTTTWHIMDSYMWENEWSAHFLVADGCKKKIIISLSPYLDPLHHQKNQREVKTCIQKFKSLQRDCKVLTILSLTKPFLETPIPLRSFSIWKFLLSFDHLLAFLVLITGFNKIYSHFLPLS